MSWSDYKPWTASLDHRTVVFKSVAGAETLTALDLGLDFAGVGFYIVRVYVVSDSNAPLASPHVDSTVPVSRSGADEGLGNEAMLSGDCLLSSEIAVEHWYRQRFVVVDRCSAST